MRELIPHGEIARRIFVIRGQKVMLDSDLAELFGVETKQLNRQVKRNIQRFPSEFMFRLTKKEIDELMPIWHQFGVRSHFCDLKRGFWFSLFSQHRSKLAGTVSESKLAGTVPELAPYGVVLRELFLSTPKCPCLFSSSG